MTRDSPRVGIQNTEVNITQCRITFTEPDEGHMSRTTETIQKKLLSINNSNTVSKIKKYGCVIESSIVEC